MQWNSCLCGRDSAEARCCALARVLPLSIGDCVSMLMWCHGWPHNGLMTGSWCHDTHEHQSEARPIVSGQWEAGTRSWKDGLGDLGTHYTPLHCVSSDWGLTTLTQTRPAPGNIYWDQGFYGGATWGLSCAPPLARHKNEEEVTEAITWSDGSDQLWATYGIQIVNCVRYPSGSRKYSILVWWCNYECWLLKPSTAKNIPNKPAIQYNKK